MKRQVGRSLDVAVFPAFVLLVVCATLAGCGQPDPFAGSWALEPKGPAAVVIAKADDYYVVDLDALHPGNRNAQLHFVRHEDRLSAILPIQSSPSASSTQPFRITLTRGSSDDELTYSDPAIRELTLTRVSDATAMPPTQSP
jgi:hypothetical protein